MKNTVLLSLMMFFCSIEGVGQEIKLMFHTELTSSIDNLGRDVSTRMILKFSVDGSAYMPISIKKNNLGKYLIKNSEAYAKYEKFVKRIRQRWGLLGFAAGGLLAGLIIVPRIEEDIANDDLYTGIFYGGLFIGPLTYAVGSPILFHSAKKNLQKAVDIYNEDLK